jgi:uncharacterized repeat protein (TIGR03803 family)
MNEEFPLFSVSERPNSDQRALLVFCRSSLHRAVQRIALGSAFLLVLGWAQPKANAQVTILHNFGDGTVPNDGALPLAGLIQAPDRNFYGDTASGESQAGVVYQVTLGGVVTVIQVFEKGMSLNDPVVYDNGKLVGITNGPVSRNSRLFALTESAKGTWSKSIWYKFSRSSGPWGPSGAPTLGTNGDLYGVTEFGGSQNDGTIYQVNAKTNAVTFIYEFQGPSPALSPWTDLLLGTDGDFYGSTNPGNSSGGIFKVTPGGKVSVVYSFSSTEGPMNGPLIEGSDGNFYGTEANSVFKLTPGGKFTVLHIFGKGKDGKGPAGAVAQGPNGNLYGMCFGGGTAGDGTIYEVSTDGFSYAVLHNFGDGSIPNDGQNPNENLLLGSDNNFYGTTSQGGSAGKGTIFKVSP